MKLNEMLQIPVAGAKCYINPQKIDGYISNRDNTQILISGSTIIAELITEEFLSLVLGWEERREEVFRIKMQEMEEEEEMELGSKGNLLDDLMGDKSGE